MIYLVKNIFIKKIRNLTYWKDDHRFQVFIYLRKTIRV